MIEKIEMNSKKKSAAMLCEAVDRMLLLKL